MFAVVEQFQKLRQQLDQQKITISRQESTISQLRSKVQNLTRFDNSQPYVDDSSEKDSIISQMEEQRQRENTKKTPLSHSCKKRIKS